MNPRQALIASALFGTLISSSALASARVAPPDFETVAQATTPASATISRHEIEGIVTLKFSTDADKRANAFRVFSRRDVAPVNIGATAPGQLMPARQEGIHVGGANALPDELAKS